MVSFAHLDVCGFLVSLRIENCLRDGCSMNSLNGLPVWVIKATTTSFSLSSSANAGLNLVMVRFVNGNGIRTILPFNDT